MTDTETDNSALIAEMDALFQKCMDDDGYWLDDLKSDVMKLVQTDQQKQYEKGKQDTQNRIKKTVEKLMKDVQHGMFIQPLSKILEIIEGKT